MSPWPGCAAMIAGERMGLLRARATDVNTDAEPGVVVEASAANGLLVAAGDGKLLEIIDLQRAGRRGMPAREALRGFSIAPGTRLTNA